MEITDKEFRKTRLKLKSDLRGKQAQAARELNVDPSLVNRVLSGDRINMELLQLLSNYRDKIKKKEAAILKKFIAAV